MRTSVKVKILGETSVKETETDCSLLPAALSFSLIGLSHEPGALGIIIYPLREVYASLNLTHILYYKFSKKSKNKGLGFARRAIPHQNSLLPFREPPLKQHYLGFFLCYILITRRNNSCPKTGLEPVIAFLKGKCKLFRKYNCCMRLCLSRGKEERRAGVADGI